MKGHLLVDMLNIPSSTFVPLTNVKVYSLITNQILVETDFMAINKNMTNDIMPTK